MNYSNSLALAFSNRILHTDNRVGDIPWPGARLSRFYLKYYFFQAEIKDSSLAPTLFNYSDFECRGTKEMLDK